MILEVFMCFIIICFIMIFLGFYTQIKVVSLIAFVGIFLLGLVLQGGLVEAQSSFTTSNTYMCSACNGYSIPALAGDNSTALLTSTSISINYTPINDTTTLWLGRWLAFAGALGFILTIISNSGKGAK